MEVAIYGEYFVVFSFFFTFVYETVEISRINCHKNYGKLSTVTILKFNRY